MNLFLTVSELVITLLVGYILLSKLVFLRVSKLASGVSVFSTADCHNDSLVYFSLSLDLSVFIASRIQGLFAFSFIPVIVCMRVHSCTCVNTHLHLKI